MPLIQIIGSTYHIFDSQGTAIAWPQGAHVSQIRILALNTSANVVFQVIPGTPVFEWRYVLHELGAGTSSRDVVSALHVIPMGGISMQTAIIPTTMTAATAWIDFL